MNPDSQQPTGHELVLAIVGAAAVVLVVPIVAVAGDLSLWMPFAAAVAAVMVFGRRDSSHGLVALLVVVVIWLAARVDAASPWTIAVALLMFTAHATLALRTTAPPGADLGRDVVVRWLVRTAVVAALTGGVYLLVFALRDLRETGAELVLAVALALLGLLVLVLRSETLRATENADRRTPGTGWGGDRRSSKPRKVDEWI